MFRAPMDRVMRRARGSAPLAATIVDEDAGPKLDTLMDVPGNLYTGHYPTHLSCPHQRRSAARLTLDHAGHEVHDDVHDQSIDNG
jgi:hypothetical protein